MSTVSDNGDQEAKRTSFERACAGYDTEFERTLVAEITKAIGLASIVTDQNVLALRTGETVAALATCMAAALAMSPEADVPSQLRDRVDQIAKRIRRAAAQARAEGIGDIFGAGKGGHA